jgi:hypothetical protein
MIVYILSQRLLTDMNETNVQITHRSDKARNVQVQNRVLEPGPLLIKTDTSNPCADNNFEPFL